VCSQFGQKFVDACSRARPHSLDDADVDPVTMLFVHNPSLHESPRIAAFCGVRPWTVRLFQWRGSASLVHSPSGKPFRIVALEYLLRHRRSSGWIGNSPPRRHRISRTTASARRRDRTSTSRRMGLRSCCGAIHLPSHDHRLHFAVERLRVAGISQDEFHANWVSPCRKR